jgi:ABC-type Fe3+-siderophore transport system permease subunit
MLKGQSFASSHNTMWNHEFKMRYNTIEEKTVDNNRLPKFFGVLVISAFLAISGWLGLAAVVTFSVPELFPRWLFFFFLNLAFTGLAMPIMYFLHLRFPSEVPTEMGVLARQALWVGVYFDLLAWLQLGRVMQSWMAFLIAMGMFIIEMLLRWRERSQFKPEAPLHE